MELGPDETSGQLQIAVQAGRQFVAAGVIRVQELWQVGTAASHTHTCSTRISMRPRQGAEAHRPDLGQAVVLSLGSNPQAGSGYRGSTISADMGV